MMKKRCPRCNTQLIKSSNYCHRCGERVTSFPEGFVAAEKSTEQGLLVAMPAEEKTEEIPLPEAGAAVIPQPEPVVQIQPQAGSSSEETSSVPADVSTPKTPQGSNSCLKTFIIVLIVVVGIAIVALCAFGGYYLFKSDLIRGLFALLSF
ncbi:MAG: hypothetical protein M1371_09250 [Actinobacteria bacterium]|nr:hypothetical protein [Actinomycetota bacterium]